MAYDLNSLATWTYSNGTLTHVPTGTSKVIDIAANPALHLILSAQHWKIDPTGLPLTIEEMKRDYRLIPEENWLERKIKWNRASETPPVLEIEQTIGAADYVDYTVYLLEDSPDYADIFQAMADAMNHGVLNGFTPAHIRSIEKNRIKAWQKFGLIGGNGV